MQILYKTVLLMYNKNITYAQIEPDANIFFEIFLKYEK